MLEDKKINYENNSQINNNMSQSNDNNIKLIKREIKGIFYYQKLIKKNNLFEKKDFFELEITIMKDYIQTKQDISLLIIIPFNYPRSEPEIYCLTEFCHPHISDGRNLLLDIIKNHWKKNIHNLEFIINKLPGFFVSFLESRKKKGNYIVGNYILGKFYSINRLKELPIFCHLITYKEKKMTLYSVKSHKIITISEISFCMFELDNNHTGYCKLVFFADLKDLIGIQLDKNNNEIQIKWKNILNDKKYTKIEIISSDCENINKILLENQKKFLNYDKISNSFNDEFDINQKMNNNNDLNNSTKELSEEEKKIMMTEKQILYVEKSLTVGDKPNKSQLRYLLSLYKSCIEYYESKNNLEKCNEYKTKMNMFEPELNKMKRGSNKKNNILIEDDKAENEKVIPDKISKINNSNSNITDINFEIETKTQEESEVKNNQNNNNFLNDNIFNFNNIQNNSNNNNNINIFNFIQPSPQNNTNNNNNSINNNNNLFDFGFDFTNLKNNVDNKNNTKKPEEKNNQIIFDFFQKQENKSDLNNKNEIKDIESNINKNKINNNLNQEKINNNIQTQKTLEEIKINNFNFNEVYKKENEKDKFSNLLNDFDFFKINKKNSNNLGNNLSLSQNNDNIEQNTIINNNMNLKEETKINKVNQDKNEVSKINKNNISNLNKEKEIKIIQSNKNVDDNKNIQKEINNNIDKNKIIKIEKEMPFKNNEIKNEQIIKDKDIKSKNINENNEKSEKNEVKITEFINKTGYTILNDKKINQDDIYKNSKEKNNLNNNMIIEKLVINQKINVKLKKLKKKLKKMSNK